MNFDNFFGGILFGGFITAFGVIMFYDFEYFKSKGIDDFIHHFIFMGIFIITICTLNYFGIL